MTANQINYQRTLEDKRSHLASEAETNRANLAREAEEKRSNLAREQENYRSNTARERETHRSNVVQESLTAARDQETRRSNLARELETNRSNLANESIARSRIAQESADKRYTADSNLAGTMYSADKGYTGRVDAAYISKHGISKSDVIGATKTAGNAVVQGGRAVLRSPLGKPTVQMVANPKAAAKTGVSTLKLAADAAVGSTLKLLGLNSSKKNQTKSKKKRSK